MKRLNFFLVFCLLAFCSVWLHAEHVNYGDYTLYGVFDGDLVIIAGNLDLNDTLTVNGDVKIISGKVIIGSDNPLTSTVDLYVNGDLIVTNTEASGEMDATITVSSGRLVVTGEIFTRSDLAKASIDGHYGVRAGQLEANGKTEANLESLAGSITVVGDIFTKSDGDAHIRSNGDLSAAAIFANGRGNVEEETPPPDDGETAYIEVGGSIDVGGMIVTKSLYGSAYIKTATVRSGYLSADSVFTHGEGISSIIVGPEAGYIDVANDIVVTSTMDNAVVVVDSGYIKAGNITTRAYGEGDVRATTYIDVWGDISTRGLTDHAIVGASTIPTIKAKSITTSAMGDAYVRATEWIDISEAIETECWGNSGDADVTVVAVSQTPGIIKAGSINTDANNGLGTVGMKFGSIIVKGTINTNSMFGDAKVTVTAGDIEAENIYTSAYGDACIRTDVSGEIRVQDVIKIKSINGVGMVEAQDDIRARSITTEAYGDGHVLSDDGSIIVQEDICTKSDTGSAYVKAANGDITAQRIKTQASTGQDDSIWAQAGSGHFMLELNEEDAAKIIVDAEFDLDADHEWNTMMTLKGTCTINGKGHKITFGPQGGMIVDTSAKLLLNNIKINNIWGESIKCEDGTGTLQLHNVVWTQTADYSFKSGAMEISGDLLVSGPGTGFMYESTQVSTIKQNSMFSLSPTMTLYYNTGAANRLAMVDETSRLNFNGSALGATQDIRFTKGTLVFDNKVIFSAPVGRTIYFGDGVLANNIGFEFHVSSHLNKEGSGSMVDVNA
ncbi:hypothetical protein KKA53_03615 [Candidatus Dependentiae bacterium]|nr:hypothetical protein [Candidatus Dependentiae bacterium]